MAENPIDQDVNSSESSTEERDVKSSAEASSASKSGSRESETDNSETLESVIADAYEESTRNSQAEDSEESPSTIESDAQKEAPKKGQEQEASKETEEKEEAEVEKEESDETEEEKDKEEVKPEDDSKLPFGKHPRFVQVLSERNELREKVTTIEKEWRPMIEAHTSVVDYCRENQISAPQFQATLKLAAMLNTDPSAAYKELKEMVDHLAPTMGDQLPSDLEEAVANEEISPEYAKELARARGQGALQTQMSKQKEAAAAEKRQREIGAATSKALTDWENSVKSRDLAFKQRANGEPMGKYEMVYNLLRADFLSNPPQSPQDAIARAEAAYAEANRAFKTPAKKPFRAPLDSSSSSKHVEKEPQSFEEAVQRAASKHGF